MKLRIGGRPTVNIFDCLQKPLPRKQIQFPFSNPRSYFYFSARYALAEGIKVLGLHPGDTVLLPAYNCGIEIEPFNHFGLRTEFYRVDRSLKVDLHDLRFKMKGNIKALLVIHYLGFPQPIEEIRTISNEHGSFLIEDCAHALLSSHKNKCLGTYGDIAVFSILKTLPVPNGGILVVNNTALSLERESCRPSRFSALCHLSEQILQKTSPSEEYAALIEMISYRPLLWGISAAKYIIAAFKKIFNIGELHLMRPDSYDFRSELIAWGMSRASENILSNTDMNRVKESRRSNFNRYLDWFRIEKPTGVTLPYNQLPEGICPLFFPLIIEKEFAREIIYRELKKRGITSHPWWDRFHAKVPWAEFSDAVYLKQRLFGLPVHQDLTPFNVSTILGELVAVLSNLEHQSKGEIS